MNQSKFLEEINKIGISLNEKQISQLKLYCDFLLEYNKHTNLTSIRDEEGVYLKHFYDSLLVTKYFDFNKINNLIDIGTGAGFPGVVLKIVYPEINLTLLDSNNKKTKFLSELVEKISINNVEIINERAEKYVQNNRHKYDVTIARAVSELRIISELSLPLTKVDGHFIALKSNYEVELDNCNKTLEVLNSNIENIYEDILPIENSRRTFIIIKLNKKIDEKYPRLYEQIIKKSLK